MACAGLDAGPATGSLIRFLPAVMPRRLGRLGADPPATARLDLVTMIYVPLTPHQSTLDADLASPASAFGVRQMPSCPRTAPLCGITAGLTLLAFDRLGNFDLFTVANTSGNMGQLRDRRVQSASHPYVAGDPIAEAVIRTYYWDRPGLQLRRYDGDATDVPVVDHVVGLAFEFWGDPDPPQHPRPPQGLANCLYGIDGTRLPAERLTPAGGSLALLPLQMLRDGPWCGSGSNQFDADLLRIRRVRVTLRVQAPNEMQRTQSVDFSLGGRGTSALRLVPDYTVTTDVAPRNLNLGR
jgi:hypothetical protein